MSISRLLELKRIDGVFENLINVNFLWVKFYRKNINKLYIDYTVFLSIYFTLCLLLFSRRSNNNNINNNNNIIKKIKIQ